MKQEKALEVLKSGRNVFLTGEAGSGKSYTINLFKQWMKEQGIPYAVTASTGIAATHIGGVTIHSWSGIGIKEEITDLFIQNTIMNKEFLMRKINSTRVLIIDEVSMLSADFMDNLERLLSGLRRTTITGEAWGGFQMVFVGDFFQLPPVAKFGKETKFAFESRAWEKANPVVCYLTEQHRQTDDEFLSILTSIRNGTVSRDQIMALMRNDLIQPKTQLFTHNTDVDKINKRKLAEIEEKEYQFDMEEGGNEYLVSMLKTNCLSPEKLFLKKGAVVMLTRNKYYDREEGEEDAGVEYVNGTLGVIEYVKEDSIVVTTVEGRRINVEQADWEIEENNVVKAWIRQYPLKLAWAVTVHKSQGMSLDEARIDLGKAFEFGQGYVAVSRVRSLAGLRLEKVNVRAFEMHPRVLEMDQEFRKISESV